MKKAVTDNEKELLETLIDVLNQACCIPGKNTLDSSALTCYANGLLLLAEYGIIKINIKAGRRVIAEFIQN